MRVATVDIGTNSVLLLVAETSPSGLVAVDERATVTRLGQGVDENRVLHPDAVARTTACLESYAARVKELGASRVAVVGTSALRDAGGGARVQDVIAARFGVPLRVISGDEEARLTFLGALSGLPREPDARASIAFDVGGGSTEVVRGSLDAGGRAVIERAQSFDIGSVRLTERHVRHDPPTSEELARLREAAEGVFAAWPRSGEAAIPIGIAGTVTTLAAVSLGLSTYDGGRVHGHVMPIAEIQRVVRLLAEPPLERRRTIPGLHPGRADVIVAGGVIVEALLDRVGAREMRVSDRGIRWGLAAELVNVQG